MPRGGRSRRRSTSSSSETSSELSFEREDPLDSGDFGEESQVCPICGELFEIDFDIPEGDRLPVRYAIQSHVSVMHPDPDSPVRKAKPAPKVKPKKAAPKKAAAKKAAAKKAAPKKTAPKKAAPKKAASNGSDDDDKTDDEDEKVITTSAEVPVMEAPVTPPVSEPPAHIPSDSQTVSQIADTTAYQTLSITVIVFGTTEPQLHNISPTDTILDFRKAIATRRGDPEKSEDGRLVYNGCRITDNTLTLNDLGIPSGSTIHFVPPLSTTAASQAQQNTQPAPTPSPAPVAGVKVEEPPSPPVDKEKRPAEEPEKDKRQKSASGEKVSQAGKAERVRGEVAKRFQQQVDENADGSNTEGKGLLIEEMLWSANGEVLNGAYRSVVRTLLKGMGSNPDICAQLAKGQLSTEKFIKFKSTDFPQFPDKKDK